MADGARPGEIDGVAGDLDRIQDGLAVIDREDHVGGVEPRSALPVEFQGLGQRQVDRDLAEIRLDDVGLAAAVDAS